MAAGREQLPFPGPPSEWSAWQRQLWAVHLEVLGVLEMARAKNIDPPGGWNSYEEFRRWADWVRAAERQTAAMHGFRVRR